MSIILYILAYLVFSHFICDLALPYMNLTMSEKDKQMFKDYYWYLFWLIPPAIFAGLLIQLFSNKK